MKESKLPKNRRCNKCLKLYLTDAEGIKKHEGACQDDK